MATRTTARLYRERFHTCVCYHMDTSRICRTMLCFGCGCDLSVKADDRRRLDTLKATNVVALWKHLALGDERYSEGELDSLLKGNGKPEDQGKMCRKCFAAYQRLIEVADTLKNNQSKFFSATMMPKDDAPPPAKRPCRYSASTIIPTGGTLLRLTQPNASACTSSPPVVVSTFLLMFMALNIIIE